MIIKRMLPVLFIAIVTMLIFSTSAFCFTAQRVIIPYGSISAAGGYWTGLAVNNQSSSAETFNFKVYDETGTLVASKNCVVIPAKGTKTDLLENFFTTPVSGRLSIYIETNDASTDRFEVTMFMGNTGTKNPGFAFQTYRSENYSKSVMVLCKVII